MRMRRKAAAFAAATFMAVGSAAFAFPGSAVADTISTNCGSAVTGKIGDTVKANTSVLGLNLGSVNLGQVTQQGTSVLSKTVGVLQQLLCKVTVTVTSTVDDVAEGVQDAAPDALKPLTDPVTGAVTGGTEKLREAAGAEEPAAASDPPLESTDPPDRGGPDNSTKTVDPASELNPGSNSPVVGGSAPGIYTLPYSTSPMSMFGSAPGAGSLFDTAPGLRYGTGFDGYDPQFGLLGEDGLSDNPIRNAGSASALGPEPANGIGLPMLLAVLALAGASAGLVRTWVLRTAGRSSA